MVRAAMVGLVLVLAGAAAQAQENHVTVDSDAGQVVIRTGYEPGEDAFSIGADGWMLFGGERLTRESFSPWPGSEFTDWQAGGETVLTSDWFAATGRLDGGDFYYEIAGFEQVNGSWDSRFVWGEQDAGEFEWYGISDGATRLERSFHVGFSGHPHGQVWLVERPGLYELTLVAWDANGVYSDSEPVQMYIRSVPAPGALAAMGAAGLLASRRNRKPAGA